MMSTTVLIIVIQNDILPIAIAPNGSCNIPSDQIDEGCVITIMPQRIVMINGIIAKRYGFFIIVDIKYKT